MNKILITGGCGFIGSHLTEYIFKKFKKSKIIIYDKITYAANKKYLSNIIGSKRIKIIKADINNLKKLTYLSRDVDLLIHVAAESHVDKSFHLSKKFIFLVNLAWFSEISLYNQVLKNFSLIVVALA